MGTAGHALKKNGIGIGLLEQKPFLVAYPDVVSALENSPQSLPTEGISFPKSESSSEEKRDCLPDLFSL